MNFLKKIFKQISLNNLLPIETIVGGSCIILSIILYRFPETYRLADALAIIATVICGTRILFGALKGVIRGKFNVDELIALAIISSFLLSEYLVAAEVAFIMTLGAYLEERVLERSRKSIEELYQLIPQTARVKMAEDYTIVPLSEVKINDLVLVKPGEEIPVDGLIVIGASSVNEANLTGESKPQPKSPGDLVYAGSVNLEGALEIKTQKVGEHTTLGRLVKLTEEALKNKTPSIRLIDKFANWFTPTVLLLTFIVYLMSEDMMRAITVLVVACPCTLVLAIPTALSASLGKAVKNGILLKGGVYLEKISEINTLIFDKTGTLTLGNPQIAKIIPFKGVSKESLLSLSYTAEKFSNHPIAQAIIKEAKNSLLFSPDPEEITNVPGKGLRVKSNGRTITVGNTRFLQEDDYLNTKEALELSDQEEKMGRTTFFVALDDSIKGIISLEDTLRDETKESISELKKLVPNLILLTGDNIETAYKVATETGIGEFKARLLPEDKLNFVKYLQKNGQVVAAIGDGINDAPLLAQADVGIAMGDSGNTISLEAASVILVNSDLNKLPQFIKIARATKSIIKQNLYFFAIAYNLIAFILAATGLITPLMGAIIHNIGSTLVVLNSMRLIK